MSNDLKVIANGLFLEAHALLLRCREARWDENNRLITGDDADDLFIACKCISDAVEVLERIATQKSV